MATPSGAAGLSGNYRISTGPTFFRFKDLSPKTRTHSGRIFSNPTAPTQKRRSL